ncbi:SagB family peptide dehydrogenase [Sorangium sp. So ce385]|uniref:SagB family peptide dehydrogenase n=1 Tax=Sorangium sp. So ce385 TaxID=3133308 RepID=UPI003F5C4AEB
MTPRVDAWQQGLVLCFRRGVRWTTEGEGGPWLSAPPLPPVALGGLSPAVLEALARLVDQGATGEELAAGAVRAGGSWHLGAIVLRHLDRLRELGLLAYGARAGGRLLATLHPISPWFELRPADPGAGRRVVLSRFAYQRRVGHEMVLESPRCHALLRLDDPRAAAMCVTLARPSTSDALAAAHALPREAAETFVGLLAAAGLALSADEAGQTEEDLAPQLAPWAFHDLLFHARSRPGRHAEPLGRSSRFRERIPAPPALRPTGADGQPIPLYRPDLDALIADDLPFSAVLERRRSLRAHGAEPIGVEALGELLYRASRVRARLPPAPGQPDEVTSRPYPSAGACYELEIYLAVNRCRGLASGLYHYDPEGHRLFLRQGRTPDVEALLVEAAEATGSASSSAPQVLVCVTSRFQRVSWCYEGVAYALTLKNVGVLFQTFHLVATAMGLACCAVGAGNSDVFARASGNDYDAETTVGELLLGTCGDDGGAEPGR